MNNHYFIQVALNLPMFGTFDYLLPEHVDPLSIQAGMRVEVPFRNQKKIGIILSCNTSSNYPIAKIKPATQIIDEQPIVDDAFLKLAYWLSEYYHAGIGEVLAVMLPTNIRTGHECVLPKLIKWFLDPAFDPNKVKRAPKQKHATEILAKHPNGLSSEEAKRYNISLQTLQALQEKDIIRSKNVDSEIPALQIQTSNLELNLEQNNAIQQISQQFEQYDTWVIDGVTGSGKTEVYLKLIEKALQQEKQALVLVPEIGLTPQTIARFSDRFNVEIAVLHSGLTDKERMHAWIKAKQGIAKIIIGTRSAVFTPMKNLGLIIIDEAHDASFKQQDSLRYHARNVAIKRAQSTNIPIILGSATHNLETLYNAQLNRFKLLHLHQRAGIATTPSFQLLDIRNHYLKEGISPQIIDTIEKTLARKEQVLIFLNRRGYAPALICHHCGWIAECTRCDAKLTYHLEPLHLHCHHCDSTKPLFHHCPECQSTNLLALGLGTVKVETVLNELFPSTKIIRIDRDSTRRKKSMADFLEAINSGDAEILIGTQMLAKGHHFPNVTLVIILDGDSGFFSSDFRATENFGQLLMQVAGRAGRAEKSGHVIIQTRNPDHPQLQSLIQNGYNQLAQDLLNERQAAGLPPYSFLSLIRAHAKNAHVTHEFLEQVKALAIKLHTKTIKILGPIPSPMSKRSGNYHSQLLLQASDRVLLKHFLTMLIRDIAKLPNAKKVRWSLDVDPTDLM